MFLVIDKEKSSIVAKIYSNHIDAGLPVTQITALREILLIY